VFVKRSHPNLTFIKHLEFVQSVIERMAGNSFLLKGWSITVATALLALATKEARPQLTALILFPAFAFWGLDAYYLRQERLFRRLYEELVADESEDIEALSMSTRRYNNAVPSWLATVITPTVGSLHGTVVGVVVIAGMLLGAS